MSCPSSDPRQSRGVVHAIVSRVARRRVRAVKCKTNAPPVCKSSGRHSQEEYGSRTAQKVRRIWRMYFRQKRHDCRPRSRRRTIAFLMLAPCSASSMLSASLRPGQWPGLRALTTPARGTDRQLRDGGRSDEAHNAVDDGIARAYVDRIPSVPHGTPPVRHNGIRSAHSADAPRARFRAHPSRHRSC